MTYGTEVLNEPAGLAVRRMAMSGYDRKPSASASEAAVTARAVDTPDISYFDEAELLGTIRRDELGGETHIAANLGAARNTDERMRLVRGMLRLVGFSELGYLTVKLDAQGRPERLYFPRSYLSANLAPHYFEAGTWTLYGELNHGIIPRRSRDAFLCRRFRWLCRYYRLGRSRRDWGWR